MHHSMAHRPSETSQPDPSGPDAASTRSPIRVLLVDDEPRLLGALLQLLKEHDIVAHTVATAEAAFHLLAEEPAYDAIVTDLWMPRTSGQELATKLRGPRLIALTGDVLARERLRHFDACLVKPVHIEALISAILGRPLTPGAR